MNAVKNIAHSLSHLFFPHTCAGCGTDIIDAEQLICISCLNDLPFTHYGSYKNNPVEKIFSGRCNISNAMSLLYFTKDSALQHLMHQFKYRNKRETGHYFGRMLGETILSAERFNHIDLLIPIPLFASRERQRGYNQATVLCEGIAEILRVPVLPDVVARVHFTETQTHKTRVERWQNMQDGFALTNKEAIEHKNILLVDDVVTTGATLEACANELLRADGVTVNIATLACSSV